MSSPFEEEKKKKEKKKKKKKEKIRRNKKKKIRGLNFHVTKEHVMWGATPLILEKRIILSPYT